MYLEERPNEYEKRQRVSVVRNRKRCEDRKRRSRKLQKKKKIINLQSPVPPSTTYQHPKPYPGYNLKPYPVARRTIHIESTLQTHPNDDETPRDDVLRTILVERRCSGPGDDRERCDRETVGEHVDAAAERGRVFARLEIDRQVDLS